MSVDFSSGEATLSASTATTSFGGTGIDINVNNGTFKGTNLDLNLDGSLSKGSIYGTFHGDGATGITGIYTENTANPLVAGAIAGVRQ